MDPDLFVAILAMDSYNRVTPSNGTNDFNLLGGLTASQIGTATVENIALPSGWQAAGFYAVAYNWNGTTVVSYRGTNEQQAINPITGMPTGGYIPVANDLLNGWGITVTLHFIFLSGKSCTWVVPIFCSVTVIRGRDLIPASQPTPQLRTLPRLCNVQACRW